MLGKDHDWRYGDQRPGDYLKDMYYVPGGPSAQREKRDRRRREGHGIGPKLASFARRLVGRA
jgi:hypothetical protein